MAKNKKGPREKEAPFKFKSKGTEGSGDEWGEHRLIPSAFASMNCTDKESHGAKALESTKLILTFSF